MAMPATGEEARGLDQRFVQEVRPFVETYCLDCHTGAKAKADFDLKPYTTGASALADHGHWRLVREMLEDGDMPPDDAERLPTPAERAAVLAWIKDAFQAEAAKSAGDPGIVLPRRLSNREYDYTVRDLTGVDLRPTKEFPIDPANTAGFDNSGETLIMSPTLLRKYLAAARDVASHLYLQPDGFAFAPFPMLADTDRDKFWVHRIIDFYRRQNTNLAAYFSAAWHFRHRAALGQPAATLADVARAQGVSAKYLATVHALLEEELDEVGPLAGLRERWRQLPAPGAAGPEAVRAGCEAMRDHVARVRSKIEHRFLNLEAGKIAADSYPLLIWKNVQYATHRRSYDRAQLQVEGEARQDREPVVEPGTKNPFGPGKTPLIDNRPGDPDLFVPVGQRARYEAAFARFSSVFPDLFYKAERGRNYFETKKDTGRYLSSGVHSRLGYFRDDQPLYELILDEAGQAELDALWWDSEFVANATLRTLRQNTGNKSMTAANPDADVQDIEPPAAAGDTVAETEIRRMQARLIDLTEGQSEVVSAAISDFFNVTNATIRALEAARIKAEPAQLEALLKFAARAYRRPLSTDEREAMLGFYRTTREEGLNHEEAMRECVTAVLVAPDMNYRLDLLAEGPGIEPYSDYALASRLSYFLWSSLPDEALLALAAAGELRRPEVMAAEARRMLRDPRARALAVEFGGNWLEFRRFEEIATVDLAHFTTFTPELRQAMYEEPVRFMLDVFQRDRSILDFLHAGDTFVNPVLAAHYGITPGPAGADGWSHAPEAFRQERGGLLPMAAFLTLHAPGLRTSPVKRGNWVVKNLLGERVPPPPADVPVLPSSEAESDLPLRVMLARHREDPSCYSCHARIDSFGLVFEGFGPIGERRTKDLAGRPVDTRAEFPDGGHGEGLAGVREHIRTHRQDDFVANFCRKLLAYALNRSPILSDDLLIEDMQARLAANEHRFSSVIESIVTSPQFLHKRGTPREP